MQFIQQYQATIQYQATLVSYRNAVATVPGNNTALSTRQPWYSYIGLDGHNYYNKDVLHSQTVCRYALYHYNAPHCNNCYGCSKIDDKQPTTNAHHCNNCHGCSKGGYLYAGAE